MLKDVFTTAGRPVAAVVRAEQPVERGRLGLPVHDLGPRRAVHVDRRGAGGAEALRGRQRHRHEPRRAGERRERGEGRLGLLRAQHRREGHEVVAASAALSRADDAARSAGARMERCPRARGPNSMGPTTAHRRAPPRPPVGRRAPRPDRRGGSPRTPSRARRALAGVVEERRAQVGRRERPWASRPRRAAPRRRRSPPSPMCGNTWTSATPGSAPRRPFSRTFANTPPASARRSHPVAARQRPIALEEDRARCRAAPTPPRPRGTSIERREGPARGGAPTRLRSAGSRRPTGTGTRGHPPRVALRRRARAPCPRRAPARNPRRFVTRLYNAPSDACTPYARTGREGVALAHGHREAASVAVGVARDHEPAPRPRRPLGALRMRSDDGPRARGGSSAGPAAGRARTTGCASARSTRPAPPVAPRAREAEAIAEQVAEAVDGMPGPVEADPERRREQRLRGPEQPCADRRRRDAAPRPRGRRRRSTGRRSRARRRCCAWACPPAASDA